MPTMMNNSLFAIAIDCADADALARFWANVLGRQVAEASTSEHAVLLAGGGDTCEPCIVFNKVPEAKIAKNRLHLDLIKYTCDDECERVRGLGAPRLRVQELGNSLWATFPDIEGNEFDLIAG